jgi:outer membrane protein insertion porin family
MLSLGRFLEGRMCAWGALRPLICLILCVFLPCAVAPAGAQESPGEEPESVPDRIQRVVRDTSARFKKVRLYPYVTSLATGGGAAPGMAYFDPKLGNGAVGIYGAVSHSIRGDSLIELRMGRIPHEDGHAPRRRLGFEWMPGYVASASSYDRFFAYGRVSQLSLEAGRYLGGYSDPLHQRSVDAVVGYRLAPGLAVQGRVGMLAVTPGEGAHTLGKAFDAGTDVPGQAWKRDYLRVTSELVWDTRVRPRHARGGSFASLRLDSYQGIGETPGFHRVALDVRHYLPLGSERHILALRAGGSWAHTGGVPVPYYLQYSLGGGRLLRSYPEHRFSGDTIYGGSAEYRFQAKRWLELAAFVDGGSASGGFAGLDSQGFRTSAGVGARLTTRDSVLLRLDVARGSEGTRFNARVGYSF